jgi:MFS family permease
MKLNYKKTFLIGLAFFSASMVWPIYNTYVPIFLEKYISSTFIIGIIMTFDNIFAVIFQPIFGALSDKVDTRYGRRMPFLLVGVPLGALFFSLIPFEFNLVSLMIFVILMNFSMSIFRAPAVALMPDLTPPPLRSKANGVINLMGGVAAVIAFGAGGALYKMDKHYPFFMGSIIMIVAVILLYTFIKEPRNINKESKAQEGMLAENRGVVKGQVMSLIFLLLAIFFWFTGYQAVEAFFSLYGKYVLGIQEGDASILLMFFSASFVLFSIPAGIIATKLGRKRTIITGIVGLLIIFVALTMIKSIPVIRILLTIGGLLWGAINVNSYPMVVEMTNSGGIGKYTGYYYFFSSMAAIVSPALFGWIRDMTNSYQPLFIYAAVSFLLALFFMMLVKHGESSPKTES